jgi:ABC-2 type transport system permease protein
MRDSPHPARSPELSVDNLVGRGLDKVGKQLCERCAPCSGGRRAEIRASDGVRYTLRRASRYAHSTMMTSASSTVVDGDPAAQVRQADAPAVVSTPHGDSLFAARELISYGEVLQELVKRDLKVRYKRSVLGLMWTMLNPLLMMGITTVVFSNVFRMSIQNFPIYMLSGYVVWAFFSQSTISASSSILDNAGLTRKIYVPPALFPLSSIIAACINLLVSFVPLAALMIVSQSKLSLSLLMLPLTILPVVVFAYGLGLVLAASSVFFHDTLYTYQVFLTAWMYLTPIFYPHEIVPEQWTGLFELNPLFHFVELTRAPIYYGTLPGVDHILIGLLYAVGALLLGWWYFDSSRRQFVSYL